MITDFPLDFARFRKAWKPNQCLALPPGFAATERADLESPVFAASAAEVRAAWLAVVGAQPRTSRLREASGQIEVVQKTPLVGFPDWITAQPVDLAAGRASICVFSRSRFGIRDFGVNAGRVVLWLDSLRARLPAA